MLKVLPFYSKLVVLESPAFGTQKFCYNFRLENYLILSPAWWVGSHMSGIQGTYEVTQCHRNIPFPPGHIVIFFI
jgi:hypothetical protein